MKTNTFYNPKNQYNESLASIPYVDKANSDLSQKINFLESSINNKIEDFRTINVKFINEDGKSWNNINDYFKSRLESATDNEIEQLKIELGQTVYIVPSNNNSYEEYICRNPKIISNSTLPEMIRLGTADSIIARVDDGSANSYGAVTLVHNLYKSNGWESFYENDLEGNIDTSKPKNGKAVAPIALKDFYDADIELGERIDSLEVNNSNEIEAAKLDFENQLSELETELKSYDDSIGRRVSLIEKAINSDTTSGEVSQQGTRLDIIEKAIGLNGCCSSCGNENCSCENNSNKCSIYCRLNDIDQRLNSNDENDRSIQEQIDEINSKLLTDDKKEEIYDKLATNLESIESLEERTAIITEHTANLDELNGLDIGTRITTAENKISTNTSDIVGINDEIEDIKEGLAKLGSSHSTLDNKISVQEATIVGLDASVNNAQINLGNTSSRLETHILAAETLAIDTNNRLNSLEASSKENSKLIKDLQSKDTLIDEQIGELISASNEYSNNFKSLEKDIEDLREQDGQLNTSIDEIKGSLEEKIAENSGTIDTLIVKTDDIVNEIKELNRNTSEIDTSIKRVDSLLAVKADNSEISRLETYVNNNFGNLPSLVSVINLRSNNNVDKIYELDEKIQAEIDSRQDFIDKINDIEARNNFIQLLVHTELIDGNKIINVPSLFVGGKSADWADIKIINSSINNENVYPEIKYEGEINNFIDNRKISISLGETTQQIDLIISAFKSANIINL